jgi:hypothetical protein
VAPVLNEFIVAKAFVDVDYSSRRHIARKSCSEHTRGNLGRWGVFQYLAGSIDGSASVIATSGTTHCAPEGLCPGGDPNIIDLFVVVRDSGIYTTFRTAELGWVGRWFRL